MFVHVLGETANKTVLLQAQGRPSVSPRRARALSWPQSLKEGGKEPSTSAMGKDSKEAERKLKLKRKEEAQQKPQCSCEAPQEQDRRLQMTRFRRRRLCRNV